MNSWEHMTVQGLYADASKIPDAELMQKIISAAVSFESAVFPLLSYIPFVRPCKVGGKLEVDDYIPPDDYKLDGIITKRGELQVDSFSKLKDILREIKFGYMKIRTPTTQEAKKSYMCGIDDMLRQIPIEVSVQPWYTKRFNVEGTLTFYEACTPRPLEEHAKPTKLLAEANISAKKDALNIKQRLTNGFVKAGYVTE